MLGEKKNYISDSGRDESTACNKSRKKRKHQRKMETEDSLAQFRGEKNAKILTGLTLSPHHHIY